MPIPAPLSAFLAGVRAISDGRGLKSVAAKGGIETVVDLFVNSAISDWPMINANARRAPGGRGSAHRRAGNDRLAPHAPWMDRFADRLGLFTPGGKPTHRPNRGASLSP